MSQRALRKSDVAKNVPQPDKSPTSTNNSEKDRRTATLNPIRFSRIQEKYKLQNLNNRLADYIERVKYLEAKNSKCIQEPHSSEEVTTRKVSNVKALCKSELDDLRNALDREVKQKRRLELENRRKTLKIEELKTKFDKISKKLKETTPYVARFNELNSKYGQALIDNKNLKDANDLIQYTISKKKDQIMS